MKRTKEKSLTIVDLIKLNRKTLGEIKKGNESLCSNPLAKGEKEKGINHYDVRNQAILLIGGIIEESTDNLTDGLRIIKEAKETFIGSHSEDEA